MWCVPASWRKTYWALPFSIVNERCNIYWTGTHEPNLCVIRIVMNAVVLLTVTQNGLNSSVTCRMNSMYVYFVCFLRGEIYMIVDFWVVGPISLIGVFHCIRWSCCILLWFILKMEAACCFEVLVTTLLHCFTAQKSTVYIFSSSHLIVVFHVFCIYLRTNSNLCHLHHKLIGFYNRDEKCLQRGVDWVFK
jgi:hypothetical protein